MKIALFNCHARSVPPKRSGGIEKNINYLIDGFIKRGHEVTLFASGDSLARPGLEIVSIYPTELEMLPISDIEKDALNHTLTEKLGEVLLSRQHEFDVICNFCLASTLKILPKIHTPLVSRIAEVLTPEAIQRLKPYNNLNYISISNEQRLPFPSLHYVATIYNGLDISQYPETRKAEDFLVFVGRISQQKNPHIAIEVAARLKKKIYVLGLYKDKHIEGEYFEKVFMPILKAHSKYAEWIGEVDAKTVNDYFNRAIASLHPVTVRESFGNAVIESMASGCPPVVFNIGAYKETVEHGKTGFLVENKEQMIDAVKHIDTIDREYCREYVEEKFGVNEMVENYLSVFNDLIHHKKSTFFTFPLKQLVHLSQDAFDHTKHLLNK